MSDNKNSLQGFGKGGTTLLIKKTAGEAGANVFRSWFFDSIPVGVTGQIKAWNGSSFVAKPVKAWNGTSWVTKPLKSWNGSAWITTPY